MQDNDLRRDAQASGRPAGRGGEGGLPPEAELRAVIDAWPDLPSAIRAGIMALVNSQAEREPEHG